MALSRNSISIRPSEVFDGFLDEFFNSPIYSGRYTTGVMLDMYEDGDNVVVEAKIPGFKEEEIEISVEDNVLTITGNAQEEKVEEDKKKKYYYKEVTKQSFTRSVSIPSKVDAENATAEIKDGMIKITMPKLPEAKPKKISVKTN